MADELNENAEFGRKKNDDEEPILVAQRYLNIYRQMHIFNTERQKAFDEQLLELSPEIRILLSTLPGGGLLLEHIEEVEQEKGLVSAPTIKKNVPIRKKESSDLQSHAIVNEHHSGGMIDASFANDLSSSITMALQETEKRYKEDMQTLTASLTHSIMESQVAMANMMRDIFIASRGLTANSDVNQVFNSIPPINITTYPNLSQQAQVNTAPAPKQEQDTKPQKQAPVNVAPAPKQEQQAPVNVAPAPKQEQQAPVNTAPAQKPQQQAPVNVAPAQKPQQQAPVNVAPAQKPQQQAPVNTAPAPRPQQQAPVNVAPAQKPQQQAPVNIAPAPKQEQQAPVNVAPAQKPQQQAPVNVAPAPKPQQASKPMQSNSSYTDELDKIRFALQNEKTSEPISLDDFDDLPISLDEIEPSLPDNVQKDISSAQKNNNKEVSVSADLHTDAQDEEWEWEYVDGDENSEEWEWEYVEEE